MPAAIQGLLVHYQFLSKMNNNTSWESWCLLCMCYHLPLDQCGIHVVNLAHVSSGPTLDCHCLASCPPNIDAKLQLDSIKARKRQNATWGVLFMLPISYFTHIGRT